jgi:hypothetical protein
MSASVTMSCTLRAALLILLLSFCANAQARTLALYAGPARGLDAKAQLSMREELQQLLSPAGIDIVWKTLDDRKSGENFDLVAVTTFDGACAGDEPVPTRGAVSLADTSIADGHILPFFRIDCTRLRGLLGSRVESAVLGRALGRLAAHEIYHIVAQTTEHQESGIAKAAFSTRDLTAPRFELDAWSVARMRPPSIARTTERSYGESGR